MRLVVHIERLVLSNVSPREATDMVAAFENALALGLSGAGAAAGFAGPSHRPSLRVAPIAPLPESTPESVGGAAGRHLAKSIESDFGQRSKP